MKKLLWYAAVAAALAVITVAAGCSKGGKGGAFTVALEEDINGVNPWTAWDFTTNQVTNQTTEGLVTFDESNAIVPLLAKSWAQTDDLTYVYEVRDDIVFSDGAKMTMDDVLYSFEQASNPEGETYFADFFTDVDSFSVNGRQFIIKLKKPQAVFKYIPATGAGRIISKAKHEASGEFIGTGPFAFASRTNGQEITLKKNANYWNKAALEKIIIDTLVFRIIGDDNSRLIALQTGAVDFSANLNEDMLAQLAASDSLAVTTKDSQYLVYLALNTSRPPMDDINVRQAVARALNLEDFHKNIVKSAGTPGGILPFGAAMYGDNAAGWRQYLAAKNAGFNLDAAKEALAKSRYPEGFTCTLVVGDSPLRRNRALYVQEALKALNITVNIAQVSNDEQSTYQTGGALDANGKRDYDMIIAGWESDYPDPDANLSIMYVSGQAGEGGYNAAAYTNARVDALIEEQRSIANAQERFKVQSQLMDIIVADTPYVIFDYSARISALNKKYTGVAANANWLWSLPLHKVGNGE